MAESNRVDDFIKVAEQKYADNPQKWERLYKWLRQMVPFEDAQRLDNGWKPIIHKDDLVKWDEVFLEATINNTPESTSHNDYNPYARHAFGWSDPLLHSNAHQQFGVSLLQAQQAQAAAQQSQVQQQYSLALMQAQQQSQKKMKKSMAEKLFGKK